MLIGYRGLVRWPCARFDLGASRALRDDTSRSRSNSRPNKLPHKRLLAGFEHLKAGDLEAARAMFGKIIETNSNVWRRILGSGGFFPENDLQAAMQCCQNALGRDPKSSRAKILMARVREALGDYDAAIREYEEVTKSIPRLASRKDD